MAPTTARTAAPTAMKTNGLKKRLAWAPLAFPAEPDPPSDPLDPESLPEEPEEPPEEPPEEAEDVDVPPPLEEESQLSIQLLCL